MKHMRVEFEVKEVSQYFCPYSVCVCVCIYIGYIYSHVKKLGHHMIKNKK